ncbi:metal ABC transporter ATP-binding protein [Helcococcus kunzii]|uniref:metal ABC transporter ATP-binding protein n=1 Tax=Helcococcus kunzii TaxID=40091 RepID=UPI0024ACBFC0|nr:ATP-binding cassette domain-containing protein [Helcococcus kunzii]
MTNILEVNNLSFAYEQNNIIQNVNLQVAKGDFVAIIGENGSGKSTFLNIILSNLKIKNGEVKLFGDNINSNNHYKDIAFISQNTVSKLRNFPTTIEEVIRNHMSFLKNRQNIDEILKNIGLYEHRKKALSALSGGQLQRVGLMLALLKDASLIILDEPTTGIDKKFSKDLYENLRELSNFGKTILMVTHELEDSKDYVDYLLHVKDGGINKVLKENFIDYRSL